MSTEVLILRLVHILGGIFWVGSAFFTSLFLMPALAASGPAAGQVMAGLQRRRLFTALPLVAVLTILSGLRLMWITSAGFSEGYFESAAGHTYGLAGGAAIIAFLVSMLVARPAAVRAASIGASLATAPDDDARTALGVQLGRLQRRSAVGTMVAVVLLTLAAAGMAVARYLG